MRSQSGTLARTEQGSVSRKVRLQNNSEVRSLSTNTSVMVEFYDLWHSLTVPNDVDLLKQLQSGMSSINTMADSLTHTLSFRWVTRDGLGSPGHKDPSWKEERQKIGDTTAHRPTHKYSLEGYGYRPQQRLCGTWKMMNSASYPYTNTFTVIPCILLLTVVFCSNNIFTISAFIICALSLILADFIETVSVSQR